MMMYSTAVVRWSLHGSGARSWSASRSRRQVPTTTQVSAADEHLGRRADHLLLQGTLPARSEGVLCRQALSDVWGQATPSGADRTHADTDWQLVQEQTSERSLVTTATTTLRRVAKRPAVSVYTYCFECYWMHITSMINTRPGVRMVWS